MSRISWQPPRITPHPAFTEVGLRYTNYNEDSIDSDRLVFGSSDPRKFDVSHGTDLLNFFGGVVERLLVQHLAGAGGA